jgi:ribulose-phosphate 3-epimerase
VSADLARIADQAREAAEGGADYLHLDVMDGRFVPVITFGPALIAAIRRAVDIPLDIHLMIEDPGAQLAAFRDAGGDIINVHVEAATHLQRIVQGVHSRDKKAGVCLNPGTPVTALDAVLPEIDQVMVMAVNPGASGQRFIEAALPKIEHFRRLIDENGYRAEIEVDGGVTTANAPRCAALGADVLVAASAIFNARAAIGENIRALRESVAALKA